MRKRLFWLVIVIIILTPATMGILASVVWTRMLEPGEMPYFYLEADMAALAWMGGVLLSLLFAGAATLYIWRWRRDNAWKAKVVQTQEQTEEKGAKDRRRFLRRLDHELKNPLTAIRAGLANLAETTSRGVRRETLGSIEAQALRLSHLATDLRKLAELEIRPLELAPVDVTSLLEEVVNVVQDIPAAADRRITLTVPQAPWPLPHVAGDWDLLFLAVYNLLDNACKFTQAGDTMEVRAFEDESMAVIEVADTGSGISEEDIPHVWEELYRGRGARGVPGSGLGLALVRAIIERHGGQTSVRSRPGQGTVFILRLPTNYNLTGSFE
jgi:two-component system OmpR family sensor kinase